MVVKRDGENQAYAGAFLGKQDVGLDKAERYTGENAAPHDDLIFQIFGAGAHKIGTSSAGANAKIRLALKLVATVSSTV